MRRLLRMLALLVLLTAGAAWLFRGAHTGWTMTSVPVRTLDEVTGIEGISYEQRLVPGLDFLAGGLVAAGVLLGVSSLVRKPTALSGFK